MKPLSLEMQAFGPFAGCERIRFSDLGEAPLFLINGPTGSGKTTILDAICYALYGHTTGDEREGGEMRCQFSDPDLLTRVQFEFELGGKRYRIERLPEQERPKQRGQGTTTQRPRATLCRLDRDGDADELLVDHKVQDANGYIRRITGLNAEQFRQVMVLPQGQFRRLLMADSKEKQLIFESLFQTGLFRQVEERLKTASAGIRRERERGQDLIRGILESGDVQDEDSLLAAIEESAEPLVALTTQRDETQRAWQAADQQLTRARELQGAFERLDRTREREARLCGAEAEIAALKEQTRLGRTAEKLLPLFTRRDHLSRDLEAASVAIARSEESLAAAVAGCEQAQQAYRAQRDMAGQRDALQKKLLGLEAARERLQKLDQARRDLAAAREALKTADSVRERALSAQQAQEGRRAELLSTIHALQENIDSSEGVDVQLLRLRHAGQLRSELADVTAEDKRDRDAADSCRLAVVDAEAAVTERERELKRVRQLWHQGQAALLAAELQAGEPCPVCGGIEHPAPAQPARETVTEADIDEAQSDLNERMEELHRVRGRQSELSRGLVRLAEQRAKLLEALGENGTLSDEDFAAKVSGLEQRAAGRAEALTALDKARSQLSGLQGDSAGLDADLNKADRSCQAAGRNLTEAETRLASAESELPGHHREPGVLEEDIGQTAGEVRRLQQALNDAADHYRKAESAQRVAENSLQNARDRKDELSGDHREALDACERALSGSPFAAEDGCLLAAMSPANLESQEARVARHEREVIETRTERATLEAQLAGRQPADIEGLEADEQAARVARDGSLREWQLADERLRALRNTREKIDLQRRRMAALEEEYKVVGTLADVACGQTGARISFQRYVLGRLLDDVLVQATQRLMKMSDGRYELIRRLESDGGRSAAGLELEVYDDYSGETRSVATLSGGESFMAALSLALGLSDVVQAQAGGIRLDTLFVDEGFGTLDPEALELAISALMELREAGRMVGIISHVSELKEQMDVRIDLSMSKGGSSLRIVSPAAEA